MPPHDRTTRAFPPQAPSQVDARGYLFVVAHMRSYSTLLTHVLGSHPEIDGYAELHRRYRTRADLVGMASYVEASTGSRRRGRWLLDKVLHDVDAIDDGIAARTDVRFLLLARRPAPALASIVRTARRWMPDSPLTDADAAARYYAERLRELDRIGSIAVARAAFLASEEFVANAPGTLARLAAWLGLGTPLRPEYRTFPLTGRPGFGDPSPTIVSGRVLGADERAPAPGDAPDIGTDALDAANSVYEAVVPRLRASNPL